MEFEKVREMCVRACVELSERMEKAENEVQLMDSINDLKDILMDYTDEFCEKPE